MNKMNCELMLTYDTSTYMFNMHKNQPCRQTGSRNVTGPKTLPTIWGTYMKLVTRYHISSINSCWEKCDEKYLGMERGYKNIILTLCISLLYIHIICILDSGYPVYVYYCYIYHMYTRFWLPCLCSLAFQLPKTFKSFGIPLLTLSISEGYSRNAQNYPCFMGFFLIFLYIIILLFPSKFEAIFKFAYNLRSMNSQSSDRKADCIIQ